VAAFPLCGARVSAEPTENTRAKATEKHCWQEVFLSAKGAGSTVIDKELKKMSRRELMDIIYQMKKNEQQMQEEIASLQEALQDKRIRLSVAGSVAEAAASITNVFSAAQMTADLYLQEIACMKEETERECAQKIEEATRAAAKIMSECSNRNT